MFLSIKHEIILVSSIFRITYRDNTIRVYFNNLDEYLNREYIDVTFDNVKDAMDSFKKISLALAAN